MESIRWTGEALALLDQRVLPLEERWLTLNTTDEVAAAITAMVVRGAPAIAITAAYGLAMAVAAGEDRADAAALHRVDVAVGGEPQAVVSPHKLRKDLS